MGAESATSTYDPDGQARRANDGEPSAGFASDVTIDEDAVDGLVTAEEFAAEFAENRDDGTLYAEYRRLVAEQPVAGITLSLIGEMAPVGYWLEQSGARRPLAAQIFFPLAGS